MHAFSTLLDDRNIASLSWLGSLALATAARRGHVATPYCLLAPAGGLACHPPQAYPQWPLHERLATVAFLEQHYASRQMGGRAHGTDVSVLLRQELHRISAATGATFVTVFFMMTAPGSLGYYTAQLEQHGLPVVDCSQRLGADMVVPGEGHPSGKLHDAWAARIARALVPLLSFG